MISSGPGLYRPRRFPIAPPSTAAACTGKLPVLGYGCFVSVPGLIGIKKTLEFVRAVEHGKALSRRAALLGRWDD